MAAPTDLATGSETDSAIEIHPEPVPEPVTEPVAESVMEPVKADKTLLAAVEVAREELLAVIDPDQLGDHLRSEMVGGHLAAHYFACTAPGYRGWQWSVSVARVAGQKQVTVCETALLPSAGALLAPEWLPYAQRLAPGDIGAGDVLPYRADDPNLEFGFEATGDEDVDRVAVVELGLGRVRVLSRTGREAAAERWVDGAYGPSAEVAVKAPASCRSCGYFLPMPGALRATFGVCCSEWSPADGSVVALDFGCGAHSEADEPQTRPVAVAETLVDEYAVEQVEVPREAPTDETPTDEAPTDEAPTDEVAQVAAEPETEPEASGAGVGGVAPAASDVDPADDTEHGTGQG